MSPPDLSVYKGKLAGLASWGTDGLKLAPKANSRVVRSYLSPSSASSYKSCPARFAVERLLPRAADPFGPAELGSAGHAVLEELMGLEPPLRTPEMAQRLISEHLPAASERVSATVDVFARMHKLGPRARTAAMARRLVGQTELHYITQADLAERVGKVLSGIDGKPLKRGLVSQLASSLPGANELVLPPPEDMQRWSEEVNDKIKGLWRIEDPSAVDVWHRELRVELNLEGVPIYGIVDRVDRGHSSIPIVVDYKTGKPGRADKHGDQLRIYSLAIAHVTGLLPHRAVAYYTAHGEARSINVERKALNKTVDTLKQTWSEMKASQEASIWPAKPSPLCGWCPLALVCPAAEAAGRNRARSDIALIGPELGVAAEPGVHVGGLDRSVNDEPKELQPTEEQTVTTTTDIKFGIEDSPWKQTVGDDLLNPNSYSAMALFALVDMALSALEAAGEKPSPAKVDALAQTFGRLVADAQVALGARASLQDGLHSRLRGALRTALGSFPVPFGQDEKEWASWYSSVLRRTVAIARSVLRLWAVSPDFPDRPWAPLAAHAPDVAA